MRMTGMSVDDTITKVLKGLSLTQRGVVSVRKETE